MSSRSQLVVTNLEELIPQDHFLRKLDSLFPWEKWAEPFEKCFKGEKEYGPKGYPVGVLLRMTVLSYLYNLGDKQTEIFVSENLAGRYFAGLSLDAAVPDETTLCRFRSRIVKRGRQQALESLFARIIEQAQKLGIEMGKVQILDSVHTESKANPEKEKRNGGNPPQDGGAAWGCKGSVKKRDPEGGKLKTEKKWFYGYKTHMSENQKTGLATSLTVSAGNASDNGFSRNLLAKDLAQGLGVTVVTGDKAYDDTELYAYCHQREIFPAIRVKKNRLEQKSGRLRRFWEDHVKQPFYRAGLKIRYKIEQKFGEAKTRHGLGRCRYLGLAKFKFQSFLTFMAMNLKRIVKLLEPGKPRKVYSVSPG